MYKSPIRLYSQFYGLNNEDTLPTVEDNIVSYIASEMDKQVCSEIYKVVRSIGIEVDEEDLILALKNNKYQYEQGYKDGYKAGEESATIHAKWNINPDGYYPYCSNCHCEPKHGNMTKYCPYCGAKMDKEE